MNKNSVLVTVLVVVKTPVRIMPGESEPATFNV